MFLAVFVGVAHKIERTLYVVALFMSPISANFPSALPLPTIGHVVEIVTEPSGKDEKPNDQ